MIAQAETLKMKQRRGNRHYSWLSLTVLTVALIFFLLPIYVMVINGLKDSQHVSLSTMWNLPESLGLGGFEGAWKQLGPNLYNSLLMVVPATFLSAMVGAVNGYFLSKWKFRGADLVFTIILFGFFIPYQVILLPLLQFTQPIVD